ncbi:MAG: DeoD-type purine-nucleoside phosphorylase, partial [Verrucomicrobiales bacterium]
MSTPHIGAGEGAFAETVLLPGDPLRAKFIAENFLEQVEEVNGVRNMLGFTGRYKGTPVSVMGSGMGIPSISIYAKELITEYGVRNLVRVGSCGAVSEAVKVRDVLIGMGGCTDSGVNRARFGGYDFAAIADYELVAAHVEAARELGVPVRVGNLFS